MALTARSVLASADSCFSTPIGDCRLINVQDRQNWKLDRERPLRSGHERQRAILPTTGGKEISWTLQRH
jgi:hypothetical protein